MGRSKSDGTVPVPRRRPVAGRVVRIDESYGRQLAVNSRLVLPVVVAAGVVELLGALVAAVLRTGSPATFRRPVKDLRKGPEFMVTPVWVRDADDSIIELEVHGHLSRSALVRGDRIRTVAIRPRDSRFPPVAGTIENLTTGCTLRPRRPTAWTHLGLPLALQAVLGAVLLGLSLLCLFSAHR